MKTIKEQVLEEYSAFSAKLIDLQTFVESPEEWEKLAPEERFLLQRQESAMMQYLFVLKARLDAMQ